MVATNIVVPDAVHHHVVTVVVALAAIENQIIAMFASTFTLITRARNVS